MDNQKRKFAYEQAIVLLERNGFRDYAIVLLKDYERDNACVFVSNNPLKEELHKVGCSE